MELCLATAIGKHRHQWPATLSASFMPRIRAPKIEASADSNDESFNGTTVAEAISESSAAQTLFCPASLI